MTGIEMVRRSLALLGVLGEAETPDGDVTQNAQLALNAMLSDWSNLGLGRYQYADLSTDLHLPDGWDRTIAYNLAVELAPEFNKEASPTVQRMANTALKRLRRVEVQPIPLSLETEISLGTRSGYNILTNDYR